MLHRLVRPSVSSSLTKFGSRQLSTRFDLSSLDVDKHSISLKDKRARWRRKDLDGQSMISETIAEMEKEKGAVTLASLKKDGQKKMTLEEKRIRRRCLEDLGVPGFRQFLEESEDLKKNIAAHQQGLNSRVETQIMQLNIGLYVG